MGSPVTFPLLTAVQLGQMLKSARKSRALSQAAVGARLGLSQKRVSALELDPGSISVDQLLRWCAVVGLELGIGSKAPPAGAPEAGKVEW